MRSACNQNCVFLVCRFRQGRSSLLHLAFHHHTKPFSIYKIAIRRLILIRCTRQFAPDSYAPIALQPRAKHVLVKVFIASR